MSSVSTQNSTDSKSTRGTVDPAAQRSASSEPAATAESSNLLPAIKITDVDQVVLDFLSEAQSQGANSVATLERLAEAEADRHKAEYNSLMGRSRSQSPSPPGSEPGEEDMEEAYNQVMEGIVPESTQDERNAVASTLSRMKVLKPRKIEEVTDEEENDSGEESNGSVAEGDDDTAAGPSSGGTQA